MTDDEQKKIFSKSLNFYIAQSGKQQKEVAKDLEISVTTFNTWCVGKIMPRMGKVQKIADYFNIGKSDLLDDKTTMSGRRRKKGVLIPVVGTVPAGIPVEAVEDIIDWEEITEDMAATGEFFALKIRGHSMEPKIGDGDIVIVRIQSDVDSGSIVIARIGNDEEVTCKKLLKNKDGVTFVPFNPSYEALYYTNEQIHTLPVTIMGKVIELRSKFE